MIEELDSYVLSDFLLFSQDTYFRLFELYNRDIWPIHLAALALGIALLWLVRRPDKRSGRAAAAILVVMWAWVGWAFHLERYATINLAAPYFAALFGVETLLLLWSGVIRGSVRFLGAGGERLNLASAPTGDTAAASADASTARHTTTGPADDSPDHDTTTGPADGPADRDTATARVDASTDPDTPTTPAVSSSVRHIGAPVGPPDRSPARNTGTTTRPTDSSTMANVGFAIVAFSIFVNPLIGILAGREWSQLSVVGLAPDPTAMATVGVLLAARGKSRWLPIALAAVWCIISTLTAIAMSSLEAIGPALVVVVALAAALRGLKFA